MARDIYCCLVSSFLPNSPFTILTTVAHSQLNLINGYIIEICTSSSNLVQAVILFEYKQIRHFQVLPWNNAYTKILTENTCQV